MLKNRLNTGRKSFKARVLSAVDCWAEVYLKLALKSLFFGDVTFTEDFFVTFPFFRGKKPPDNLRLLKQTGEIWSVLEGMQISCKWLKNLQPTILTLFLAAVEHIVSCALIQLYSFLTRTLISLFCNLLSKKKKKNCRSVIWNSPNIWKNPNIPRETLNDPSDPRALQYSLFCSICTVK